MFSLLWAKQHSIHLKTRLFSKKNSLTLPRWLIKNTSLLLSPRKRPDANIISISLCQLSTFYKNTAALNGCLFKSFHKECINHSPLICAESAVLKKHNAVCPRISVCTWKIAEDVWCVRTWVVVGMLSSSLAQSIKARSEQPTWREAQRPRRKSRTCELVQAAKCESAVWSRHPHWHRNGLTDAVSTHQID